MGMYFTQDFAPSGVKDLTAFRIKGPHDTVSCIMAQYGSAHHLPRKLLRSKGLFGSLVEGDEGPRFLNGLEVSILHGAVMPVLCAFDSATMYRQLGNCIAVPHALLGLWRGCMSLGRAQLPTPESLFSHFHPLRLKSHDSVLLPHPKGWVVCRKLQVPGSIPVRRIGDPCVPDPLGSDASDSKLCVYTPASYCLTQHVSTGAASRPKSQQAPSPLQSCTAATSLTAVGAVPPVAVALPAVSHITVPAAMQIRCARDDIVGDQEPPDAQSGHADPMSPSCVTRSPSHRAPSPAHKRSRPAFGAACSSHPCHPMPRWPTGRPVCGGRPQTPGEVPEAEVPLPVPVCTPSRGSHNSSEAFRVTAASALTGCDDAITPFVPVVVTAAGKSMVLHCQSCISCGSLCQTLGVPPQPSFGEWPPASCHTRVGIA